ncbi:hypothetical protein VTK56DRAFT_9043 [Thermocarpiscus australiensis]
MPHSASAIRTEEESATAIGDSLRVEEDHVMADAEEVEGDVEKGEPAAEPSMSPEGADADAPDAKGKKRDIKLEDLFDGVDSDEDDEFPSSSNPLNGEPPSSQREEVDPKGIELLRTFYQRLFPWRYMYQWLNHSPTPTNDFKHREFSLWLPNDAMLRYQAYASSDLFRKDVLRLMPTRIEIGPVYTANPLERKIFRNSTAFRPLAKELCFDIDLTDYDDIRTCCDKANICIKCWQFMTMAIKVLDTALREDFGFQHILWVYSGRRGAHAWVCDKKARTLDDQQRKAITGYFDVVHGGKESGKRVNLRRPLHPHLQRSLDILKPHFQKDVLEAQDPWKSPERADSLLQLIPDSELREALRKKWDAAPGRASSSKWADIDALAQTHASGALDPADLLDAKQDIVLEHTYPRLDVGVSQKLNHLLKSPFVVHPGTGRVCVPIDTRALDEFDPLGVPTLQDLVREIDSWSAEAEAAAAAGAAAEEAAAGDGAGGGDVERHLQDWEKTSLKPYIDYFRAFATALMKDEREVRVKREREEEEQAESLEF